VVDPGRICIATETALCYVYPVILTPETRGHVCQKFHHPTIFKNLFDNTNLWEYPIRLKYFIKNLEIIEIIQIFVY